MSNRPTPETDAVWDDKSQNILEHARRLERERNDLLDRLTVLEHSMPVELARLERQLEDSRSSLREIFNITQIGDPHPPDLPIKALQAIAEMIDEHLKEARK